MHKKLKPWLSTPALLRLLYRFLEVFGVFWLLLEPLALWQPDNLRFGFYGYFGLAVISFLVALILARPRTLVERKLPSSDTKITIGVGDLLEQQGNIVIGCPDTFDTEIGEVISPTSIQGQFQARIFPERNNLDSAINNSLKNGRCEIDEEKPLGKKSRYPIGTVAEVEYNGNKYFLVAYTRMRNDMRVESDICMLSTSLNKCWEAIRTRGQHKPVHIGIIGSGLARIGLSRALLLQFIVLSFVDAERKESLTNHLTIHIHEKDAECIDFVDLEAWLKGLTRAA
jgi:hypothetical protein